MENSTYFMKNGNCFYHSEKSPEAFYLLFSSRIFSLTVSIYYDANNLTERYGFMEP